jgi:hypothetical protein
MPLSGHKFRPTPALFAIHGCVATVIAVSIAYAAYTQFAVRDRAAVLVLVAVGTGYHAFRRFRDAARLAKKIEREKSLTRR